jgi:hypothetical protein
MTDGSIAGNAMVGLVDKLERWASAEVKGVLDVTPGGFATLTHPTVITASLGVGKR